MTTGVDIMTVIVIMTMTMTMTMMMTTTMTRTMMTTMHHQNSTFIQHRYGNCSTCQDMQHLQQQLLAVRWGILHQIHQGCGVWPYASCQACSWHHNFSATHTQQACLTYDDVKVPVTDPHQVLRTDYKP